MKNSQYLLNPVLLVALLGLLFNDYYLKFAHPSFLSGKLSDLTGIVVFVLFFTFLFGNQFKKAIFITTALLFCWWKSSLSTGFITNWNELFSFYTLERVVDYTDLICLLILVPVYFYKPKEVPTSGYQRGIAVPVFALSVFAIAATSKAKNSPAYGIATRYEIEKSFKLKMTQTEFLEDLSFSNITIEKDPNAVPPPKPGDPHAYILKNFTISDNLVVESMFISIKAKKKSIKLSIHDVYLLNHPEGTHKEIREILIERVIDFFPLED